MIWITWQPSTFSYFFGVKTDTVSPLNFHMTPILLWDHGTLSKLTAGWGRDPLDLICGCWASFLLVIILSLAAFHFFAFVFFAIVSAIRWSSTRTGLFYSVFRLFANVFASDKVPGYRKSISHKNAGATRNSFISCRTHIIFRVVESERSNVLFFRPVYNSSYSHAPIGGIYTILFDTGCYNGFFTMTELAFFSSANNGWWRRPTARTP